MCVGSGDDTAIVAIVAAVGVAVMGGKTRPSHVKEASTVFTDTLG